MKENYIKQIIDFINTLSENQIFYLLTLMKKLFGSH